MNYTKEALLIAIEALENPSTIIVPFAISLLKEELAKIEEKENGNV